MYPGESKTMWEQYFQCPYCWEEISMILDLSSGGVSYIEDCEVCCQPIEIEARLDEEENLYFDARSIEQ